MAEIFTIIAPVFLIMALGFFLGKTKLFPEGSSAILISFVWYVAIPALMFRSLAPKDLPSADELVFVGTYYGCLYIVYTAGMLLTRKFFGFSSAEQGVFSLTTCFVNGGFIGIPIMDGAFGTEGVRLLLVILSFHTLTLIPITTFIIEKAQKTDGKGPGLLRVTFNSVRQNPILIALLAGLAWSALSLPFPNWLDKVLELPANAAAPVGLFAAGLALSNVRIAGNLHHSMLSVALKLLILPLLVFSVAHFLFELKPMWVGVATLTAALPSGMVPYTIALRYGVGARRAATAVLLSTGLSAITLSAVLYFLQNGAIS
ncbi:MAG: AEC family transporter [Kordiimonadaceae bacterium]|nr:AEC family transporter [Kordiimonadaceae bacterium]